MSIEQTIKEIAELPIAERIEAINNIRAALHEISPFKSEPVDFVRWVPCSSVYANDYNPNSVAPPEMELLRLSIEQDGYTQPIVGMLDEQGGREVIDGFHRHRVGKECPDINARVHGYLPIVQIRQDRTEKTDRMAATIRHNRARGKHRVDAMSDIVVELKRRNWSDDKIAKNLGMDADEILRLTQITGLAELFGDQEFSRAWEIEEYTDDTVISDLEGETEEGKESERIYHTWDKWECYPAGFYDTKPPEGMDAIACEKAYRDFLADDARFRGALEKVITQWVKSCEHYLTNDRMNRIAWLGQAAMCIDTGVPARFRGGYFLLPEPEQLRADQTALEYLNKWRAARGLEAIDLEAAGSKAEVNLY